MDKNINFEQNQVWQDREIRFDVPNKQLSLRPGEKVLDKIQNVEDTKGNNGDIGILTFTNLRLIWFCQTNIKINLSVGYDCIVSSEIKAASSKVAGDTRALYIKSKFSSNRFEFVFNALGDNNPQLFSSFHSLYRAYENSRYYRDIKTKGFTGSDKNLATLPQETVVEKLPNVTNLCADQSINGTYYMTNVRLVWYSNTVDRFNVSLPWIQMKNIKSKDNNKAGKSVMIETGNTAFTNMVNLKFNEDNEKMLKSIRSSYKTYAEDPIFGVENFREEWTPPVESGPAPVGSQQEMQKVEQTSQEHNKFIENNKVDDDDVEIVDNNYFNEHSNMAYYMTSNQEKKNALSEIIYSAELGLACERPPVGTTLESIWKIIM